MLIKTQLSKSGRLLVPDYGSGDRIYAPPPNTRIPPLPDVGRMPSRAPYRQPQIRCITPPSIFDFKISVFNTGTTPKTVASSWAIGDVLVVISFAENTVSLPNTPTNTGSGLTWTDRQTQTTGNNCTGRLSTAVASAADSGNVSVSNGNQQDYGFALWVWRGSDGIGNSTKLGGTPQATKTVSYTPTQADSGICWGISDFNADAAYTAGTPAVTNTRLNAQVAGHYTNGLFDLTDQTSAGAVSYGATGGGTTGPFLIFVMEIKGTAGGATAGLFQQNYLDGVSVGGPFFSNPLN